MTQSTKRVFLLGDPAAHSASPAMHNAAFRALRMDWQYEALETPRGQLRETVARLRRADCAGANVTLPHKQAVAQYLDALSDPAQAIGAVNTIVTHDGKLTGENTDAAGIIAALREAKIDPSGACIAILGAGGAAGAVAFAAAAAGAREIILINRTVGRATALAERLHTEFRGLRVTVDRHARMAADSIFINATPVGMWPHIADSPLPPGHTLCRDMVVVDLIYNPLETRLLRDAKRAGAQTMNGLAVLVHQGAAAFALWTGRRAPVRVMFDAARRELESRPADT